MTANANDFKKNITAINDKIQKAVNAKPVVAPATAPTKPVAPKEEADKPIAPYPLSQKEFAEWKKFVIDFCTKGKKEFSLNRPYVSVEAWAYLFAILDLRVVFQELKTSNEYGNITTSTVKAILRNDDNEVIADAVGFADNLNVKDKISNRKSAVISLAQTRAMAKLGRMKYGHLALMAGFEATPLEEMSELV